MNYATANGTATAGSDYVNTSGSLTFSPGQTSKTITVSVNGDTQIESNETFFVNLSSASNATIADSQGLGTITNDDQPGLSINDVSVTEGNSGTVNAVFTVSLSASSSQTVTVNYATANNTATAGSDYVSTSGTLTFNPNETSKTITVSVNGDTLDEPNETFFVNLSGATNATISDSQGQGTILDDDPTPSLAINDVTVTEGNSGTVNAVFTVTLSAASGQTVTVNYATANNTATAGSDYVNTSGSLTFNPNETSKTITIPVNGDTLDEPNETFFVNLSGATNATISDSQGQGTILDDDVTLSVVPKGSGTGTVSSDPPGISCGTTCSATYGSGDTVTLTHTADSESTFKGWQGEGCSGTGTCTVKLDSNKEVTAVFSKIFTDDVLTEKVTKKKSAEVPSIGV